MARICNPCQTFKKLYNARIVNPRDRITLSKNQTIPYEFTEIKDGNTVTFNPCSEHPKGEKFNDCFKREFSDFCDGLVGCLSLAVFPWHISAVIAAHCLAC